MLIGIVDVKRLVNSCTLAHELNTAARISTDIADGDQSAYTLVM